MKKTKPEVPRLTWFRAAVKLCAEIFLLSRMRLQFSWLCNVMVALSITCAAAATSKPAAKSGSGTPKSTTVARNPYLGALVVEAASGKVLFEDNADAKGYPASVLKLMDLLLILERVERGQMSLQDQVPVSAKASRTGGSEVWLKEKESFTVDDMLYALMVRSANDAAVALAEKVGGTTEAFVELMNAKAKELGMSSTVFQSVHGLPPGKGQRHDVTTARDLSVLCREVLKHPDALRYTSTRLRTFRPNDAKAVEMRSHNPLLGTVEGCDGLKTGYIAASGFSIAVTVARNGQRIIVVVLDSVDRKVRDAKAKELVAKGFSVLQPAGSASKASNPPGTKGARNSS